MNLYNAMQWRCIGPFRGGRSVAVAGHPDLYFTYFMGTTGGGLWKTEDGGANWINVSGEIANCKRSIRIVEEHCQSIGRNPSEINKSWGEWAALFEDEDDLKKNDAFIKTSPSTWCGTPEQYVDRIQEYVDLGVSYITPRFVDLPSKKSIRLFAERVIPQFK